jgi:glycosyltransferase involved in cell wall biosynthesis
MTGAPDVSIVIATRNRPDSLERALASAVRQTFVRWQALVVDDGSEAHHQQANLALVERLGSRARAISVGSPSPIGSGPALSRNRGLFAADGRYIAFLDDDDTWIYDDHLRVAVEALDDSGADVYCGNMKGVRGDVVIVESWLYGGGPIGAAERVLAEPPVFKVSPDIFVGYAKRRVIHPNMFVIRRTLVNDIGGFPLTQGFGEDAAFALRAIDRTRHVLFSPVVIAKYRFPEGDSYSLTMTRVEQELQMLQAARHVGIVAQRPAVRRAAGDMEAWSLRALSRYEKSQRRTGAAVRLALQGLVAYPTAGAFIEVGRALLPSRVGRPPVPWPE